jgi:NADPH:quinone reductase-like Zn-dependent oxidoreductase
MTTCSPKNFVLVRNCGAEYVFDYADADVIDQITEIEPNLRHIFDTIGNKTSSGIASQAASRGGGALCTVRPGKMYTENVPAGIKVTDVLVWTAFLKEHRYGDRIWPVSMISRYSREMGRALANSRTGKSRRSRIGRRVVREPACMVR